MSYISDAVSGVASDATGGGLTGKDWLGIGLTAGGGALPLLFGGGSDATTKTIDQLRQQATAATDLSKVYGTQGGELMQPVSQYLRNVLSGNRQDVLAATMPERRRVIDQYATAKKALGEFTPRGGGQASSLAGLEGKQASDLATLTGQARQAAVGEAGNLGVTLQKLGLDAQSLASGDLGNILKALQEQDKNKGSAWGTLGSALGTIAGFFL